MRWLYQHCRLLFTLALQLELMLPDLWLWRPYESHSVQLARILMYLFSLLSGWHHQYLDIFQLHNRCAVKARKSVWFTSNEFGINMMIWWVFFLETIKDLTRCLYHGLPDNPSRSVNALSVIINRSLMSLIFNGQLLHGAQIFHVCRA